MRPLEASECSHDHEKQQQIWPQLNFGFRKNIYIFIPNPNRKGLVIEYYMTDIFRLCTQNQLELLKQNRRRCR